MNNKYILTIPYQRPAPENGKTPELNLKNMHIETEHLGKLRFLKSNMEDPMSVTNVDPKSKNDPCKGLPADFFAMI
jgi:hypothetical protein